MLEKYRKIYNQFDKIYCHCLKTDIFFNAKGFHHLRFEVSGRPRSKAVTRSRIVLLPLVMPVIRKAKDFDTRVRENVRVSRKRRVARKTIIYFTLIERVGKRKTKVKVILRRVGNGKIIFWSVMRLRN